MFKIFSMFLDMFAIIFGSRFHANYIYFQDLIIQTTFTAHCCVNFAMMFSSSSIVDNLYLLYISKKLLSCAMFITKSV